MIRWFKDVGSDHLALVGGKGANLGDVPRAGFPVPPGFILIPALIQPQPRVIQAEFDRGRR